ncbi:MAG TPA: HEAT repeat domain-containing protein, partial [Planctomycetota bacterium]|nr:HEAT repeat domain-containing protein [Planctomycetota bacterium]
SLRNLATTDPQAQRRIFDVFMATNDPEMLEAAKECLYSLKDADLLQKIADSMSSETNPDRRAALAFVLGMNLDSDIIRPLFEAILAGNDTRLQESALSRMCVQNVQRYAEFSARLVPQLRQMVMTGATPEVRARAATALRGDQSKEGVEFLIDRMNRDPDPNVQMKAMVALPVTYSSGGPHSEEQIRALLAVATDESRSAQMRRWAADRVLMQTSIRNKELVTEEQRAVLKAFAEKK